MTGAVIVAAGAVGPGFLGGADSRRAWRRRSASADPCDSGSEWPANFGVPPAGWRRADRSARATLLAAESVVAVGAFGDDDERARTTLAVVGSYGCLDADLRFRRGLLAGAEIEPGVFVYTSPNACLGEVAIRHRLCGPTCAWFGPSPQLIDDALAEAAAPVADGTAPAALVFVGDALGPEARRIASFPEAAIFGAYLLRPADGCDRTPGADDYATWRDRIVSATEGAP